MVFARDVLHLKPVHHGLQLDIHESWVGDVFQVLLVTQYGEEWFVVNAKNQVLQTKDKKLAFCQSCDDCMTLSFYRVITALSWSAKLTATIYCLPTSSTAAWGWITRAGAMLLCQPKAHPKLCPVRGEGSG